MYGMVGAVRLVVYPGVVGGVYTRRCTAPYTLGGVYTGVYTAHHGPWVVYIQGVLCPPWSSGWCTYWVYYAHRGTRATCVGCTMPTVVPGLHGREGRTLRKVDLLLREKERMMRKVYLLLWENRRE